MNHALRTIAYFLLWGTFYGLVLGAWSGTAIFPALGTPFGAGWGIGMGAACGLLAGIATAIAQAYTFHPDVDLGRFRRRLSLGIGILVPIASTIMLIATTRGFLWQIGYVDSRSAPLHPVFLLASLASILIWGGLSAAYVASEYPQWLAQLKTGARSPLIAFPSFRYSVPRITAGLVRRAANWGILILGALGGMLYQETLSSPYSTTFYLGDSLKFTAAGIVIAPVLTLLISFGNAALLTFLKKTVFAEDVMSVSPRKLRWIFTIIAFVFTGITSFWTLIFAPLCALLMALYVYDAFPLFDEEIDKAKRKEKNTLALEEEGNSEEELEERIVMEEDHLLEAHQR